MDDEENAMELHELTKIVTSQTAILSRMEEQGIGMVRRLEMLETATTSMTDLKISMSKVEMNVATLSKDIAMLTISVEKINTTNKTEHDAICLRLKSIEDVPGEKWGKLSWYIIIAAVAAVISWLTKGLVK